MPTPARGLGRGLESLIPPTVAKPAAPGEAFTVQIHKIRANRFQPRKHFNEEALKELSDSIRRQGLIQPILVTPIPEGSQTNGETYELIAGERRWRAAKLAGLIEIPVVVKKVSYQEQFQIALIENLQREDLNPIEEAIAYKKLMEEFKITQEELAKTIGKSRVVVANTLRLLNLPQNLQDAVASGTISPGHARSLVSISDGELQKQVAEQILNGSLTVRQVEKIVADWKGMHAAGKLKLPTHKDPELRAVEEQLQQILGTKVEISARGLGQKMKGVVKISYFTQEDLERLVEIFKRK